MSSRPITPLPESVRTALQVTSARSKHVSADVPETLPIAPPDNPRVQVMASPNGTVRIVGVTLDGEWVAEHCCKATRFTERHVRAMERTVKDEEALKSVGEARVIQFPTRDAG